MLLLKSITSVDRSIVPPGQTPGSYLSNRSCLYFHYASGFTTQILAYMLDSLVRVSRRVNENHFVRIANRHLTSSDPVVRFSIRITLLSKTNHALGTSETSRE